MEIKAIAKRWGSSIGVIIPKDVVEAKRIKENDEIIIEIVKKADISDIFGLVKKRKMSGQNFKDMVRKGWESESDRKKWKN